MSHPNGMVKESGNPAVEGGRVLVKEAAQKAAAVMLSTHWDGTLPVDPVAIAEKLGIKVSFVEFEDPELSGAITASGGAAEILISEKDRFERQLFTCAHEIGHYVERKDAEDGDYTFKESERELEAARGRGWSMHELYADEFAGNLLMPQQRVKEFYEDGVSVSDMADIFSVSRSAIHTRLDKLKRDGILTPRYA